MIGGPSGKAALSCSSAAVTQPSGKFLPAFSIAAIIGFVEESRRWYSLICNVAVFELHVCQPNSRQGEGQGLELRWPSICLAAMRWALSIVLVCVGVRLVDAMPHPAPIST